MLAIIGGTGFGEYAGLVEIKPALIGTPFGDVYLETGSLNKVPVVFLPRHGQPARFPPHRVNYRANITALAQLGVRQIIAVTAVGSVVSALQTGAIVMPDQIIDYTHSRAQSFHDDEIHHIDFTYPYDEGLRREISLAAALLKDQDESLVFVPQGVYGCTQGPRLETAAEISRMAQDGCTIVGMTAMPEAALAREKNLAYAGVSVVVNAGAGINDQAVDLAAITSVLEQGMAQVRQLLSIVLKNRC